MDRHRYLLVAALTGLTTFLGCAATRAPEPTEKNPPAEEKLDLPHTPPSEFGETAPPAMGELLFEGLVTGVSTEAFNSLVPGVFFSLPNFPIELGDRRDSYNPLGLPDSIRRVLARISPEIRMWGTDRGVAVERRGWEHTYVARSDDGSCAVMFDFRVNVVERRLASRTTFGRINRPIEYIQVLTPAPQRTGLYVLVIATVEVNTRLFGVRFQETNTDIVNERRNATPPQPTDVASMTRGFIVEHELMHAEQLRRAYREVVDQVVRDHSLCRTTRPVDRHAALVRQGFGTTWTNLTTGGQGGDHSNPNYPNTPAETEARRAAWALLGGRTP